LHNDTYRIRGGLYRNTKDQEEKHEETIKHKVPSKKFNIGKF